MEKQQNKTNTKTQEKKILLAKKLQENLQRRKIAKKNEKKA